MPRQLIKWAGSKQKDGSLVTCVPFPTTSIKMQRARVNCRRPNGNMYLLLSIVLSIRFFCPGRYSVSLLLLPLLSVFSIGSMDFPCQESAVNLFRGRFRSDKYTQRTVSSRNSFPSAAFKCLEFCKFISNGTISWLVIRSK